MSAYHKHVVQIMLDGSHPDVSRDYQNRVMSVKHNLIYSLITIRLATCVRSKHVANLIVINE